MEHGNSPSDVPPDPPLQSAASRLTEAELQALRERSAQARAVASAAISQYAMLLAESRARFAASERILIKAETLQEILRQSVQRYVVLLKALDTPPERMLRLVREAVAEQVPHPEREEDTSSLFESVVNWSIQAYYDDPPAA